MLSVDCVDASRGFLLCVSCVTSQSDSHVGAWILARVSCISGGGVDGGNGSTDSCALIHLFPAGDESGLTFHVYLCRFFDSIHCFWLNFYSVCLARFGGILMLLLLLLLVFTARRCASA